MKRARNRITRVLALALSFSVVLAGASGPISGVRADTISDRIAAARQHQKDLQRSIEQQQQQLQGLQDDESVAQTALSSTSDQLDSININQSSVSDQIQTAADALTRVEARRDALRAELRQLDYTLSLLESQIQQGTEDLQTQRQALGDRLAVAYRTQQTSLLEQVLSSSSFTDVLSQASAYLSLGQQDQAMASSIADDQSSLDSLRRLTIATRYRTDELRRDADSAEAELVAQQATLTASQAKLDALEAQTTSIQNEQLAAFNKINDTQDKINAALAKQVKQQAQLDKSIKSLVAKAQREAARRERNNPPPPGGGLGGGGGPLIWPTNGVVTQEFGCTGFPLEPPLGNCAHFHQGIDIANAAWTPVRAAMSGVVAMVGYNPYERPDPAYMIVIGSSRGFQNEYVHLEPRAVVRRGQYVRQGQLIGYMGNTGNSTGTHLHWQVSIHGHLVNPRSYV